MWKPSGVESAKQSPRGSSLLRPRAQLLLHTTGFSRGDYTTGTSLAEYDCTDAVSVSGIGCCTLHHAGQ